jgi:hypothetical protein
LQAIVTAMEDVANDDILSGSGGYALDTFLSREVWYVFVWYGMVEKVREPC